MRRLIAVYGAAWLLWLDGCAESTIAGRRGAGRQNSIFEPNTAALYHNLRFRQQVRSLFNTVALRHELVYFAASLTMNQR
jgi:hypothetical protein